MDGDEVEENGDCEEEGGDEAAADKNKVKMMMKKNRCWR